MLPYRKITSLLAVLFAHGAALAQAQLCPDGLFPEPYGKKACRHPSEYNELPLDDSSAMKFEGLQVGMGTIWIQATGTITSDTPREFARFLESYDATTTDRLFLHSPGGNLGAGLELGRQIRKAGYSTSIGRTISLENGPMNVYSYPDAYCASACAYAFLGGVTRSFGEDDLFGLHRFKSNTSISSDDAQVATSLIAAYLEDMGVGQDVLRLASSTAPDDIALVSPELAKKTRIIFNGSGITEFRVERLGQADAALFNTSMRGRSLGGMVKCAADGTPLLVISQLHDDLPEALKRAVNFKAEFTVAGREKNVAATVSYVENSSERGMPTLVFAIPGLTAPMFEYLELWTISNPDIRTADDWSSYKDRLEWDDAVRGFSFHLSAKNARQALPVVLDRCAATRIP